MIKTNRFKNIQDLTNEQQHQIKSLNKSIALNRHQDLLTNVNKYSVNNSNNKNNNNASSSSSFNSNINENGTSTSSSINQKNQKKISEVLNIQNSLGNLIKLILIFNLKYRVIGSEYIFTKLFPSNPWSKKTFT
jgi:hypothetical protein